MASIEDLEIERLRAEIQQEKQLKYSDSCLNFQLVINTVIDFTENHRPECPKSVDSSFLDNFELNQFY